MTTDQQIFEILEKLIELTDEYDLDLACSKVYSISRKNLEFTAYLFCRNGEQKQVDFITVHDGQVPLWTFNGNVVSRYELIYIVEIALAYWTGFVEENYCTETKLRLDDCDCYDCRLNKEAAYTDFVYDLGVTNE